MLYSRLSGREYIHHLQKGFWKFQFRKKKEDTTLEIPVKKFLDKENMLSRRP